MFFLGDAFWLADAQTNALSLGESNERGKFEMISMSAMSLVTDFCFLYFPCSKYNLKSNHNIPQIIFENFLVFSSWFFL